MSKPKNDARYLVFVDFDGVLTSARVHFSHPKEAYFLWATFDPVAIEFFNKIHNTFEDVRFVWTTTWRNHIQNDVAIEHIAYSQWYNAGFRGLFGTPWLVNPENRMDGDVNHANRAAEIQHYMDNYGEGVQDYIIFDDSDYGFNDILPKKRWIKTSPNDGLLFKHMEKAWSIVGQWDRKGDSL